MPIWTCYEVLLLWAYANGHATMIHPGENPLGFIALFFLVPFVHEVGFYFAHRFLHWPPLYWVAPAQGHTGFDRVVTGDQASMDTSYYAHYLPINISR